MNDFSGPECSYQRDLSRGSFVPSHCHLEFSTSFNEGVHSGPVQHYRDHRALLYTTHQDGPGCPGVDKSLRDDDLDCYRFYCPVSSDPSPSLAQYSSVSYPDYLLHQAGPCHFLSPPPGLGKHAPHPWTPEEAFLCGMPSAEMREAVASINSEGADELYTQACSRHKSAGELRQCNQLDMGQNNKEQNLHELKSTKSSHPLTVLMPPRDQTGEKLAVQNGNMCQVVCDVNGGGQMVLLNHCSPSQIIHPMVLGHSVSSAEPPLYTADHPHSPEHCPLQGRGDGPVSQVPGGYTSPPYLSSFTNSNTHPSSNLISTAPGYTFNTMPGPYTSQFHQTPCAARADTVETRHSGAQTVRAWERSKKPCNCTKSQCLKLYCDCFANGEFCSNCKCINCCNNMEHESERYRAIKTCLERNPAAFRPKISNRKLGDVKNRHTKGCNCKRSGCLKNYCECYEAKIMCSSTCKCVGCRNYDGSPVRQHTAWQSPDATDIYSTGSKCPLSCITSDVVEATCGCLLAQAEEAEREGHTRPHAERLILEEFGQCLTQIVRSIFKSTGVQW